MNAADIAFFAVCLIVGAALGWHYPRQTKSFCLFAALVVLLILLLAMREKP